MLRLQTVVVRPHLRWLVALVIAGLLLAIRFWPMIVGQTLMFGDNYSLMVPGKLFMAEWLRQGIVPLWNPYSFGGLPLAGDINQSLWYPSTILFVIMSPAVALNLTIIIHQLIAFAGMFGLGWWLVVSNGLGLEAKEQVHQKRQIIGFWLAVLAGVLWMFSPQVSGSINNLATLQSIVWLPAIMWAGLCLRVGESFRQMWRQTGLIALLLTVQLVGGYPQHVLFSGMAVFGCSLIWHWWPKDWRWWISWGLAAVLTIGLSAWVWLPFRSVLLESTRTLQSTQQAGAGSLHPTDLIKIALPYFFDNPRLGMKWGPQWNSMPNVSLYAGWLGLVIIGLAFFAKQWRRFDWLMLLAIGGTIAFAFGERFPLLKILQEISPVFRFSRGPSTILMVTTVLLTIWLMRWLLKIALRFSERSNETKKSGLIKIWWVVVALALMVMIGSGAAWLLIKINFAFIWQLLLTVSHQALAASQFHTFDRDQVILLSITSNIFWNCLFLLLSLIMLRWRQWLLLVTVVGLDMIYNTNGLFFFAPAQVYQTGDQLRAAPAARLLTQVPISRRVLIRNYNYPYTDFSAYWEALTVRAPFSDSYIDEEELRDYHHLQRFSTGLTPAWNAVSGDSSITGYTTLLPIDVQAVWGDPDKPIPINNLSQIKLSDSHLAEWAVGYYLVDTSFDIKEDLRALQLVGERDSWRLYQFPQTKSRFRYDTDEPVKIEKIDDTPNQITLSFIAPASASALIVADRFDQGWSATVNDQPARVVMTDHLRRIAIQPAESGHTKVVLNYWPMGLSWGWRLSILSLCAWLVGNWWLPRFSRDFN